MSWGAWFYAVDEPEMSPWMDGMARQADCISREMQPVVEMAGSVEPYIRQVAEAAAVVAPGVELV